MKERGRDSRGGAGAALAALAAAALLLAVGRAQAAEMVFQKETGPVKSSCLRDKKSDHLVCVVVLAKPPYLGFQFGSERDSESIAVTAGARRLPNERIEIRVDNNIPHDVYGDGFVGKEAEALLYEIEKGRRVIVSVESRDAKVKERGVFDLTEFKAALRQVQALRALHEDE